MEWRDRRGSHLKQGGSSNTSTRQEQDGCLSRDRERRRQPRRREWSPRDTPGPASLAGAAYPGSSYTNYKAQAALRFPTETRQVQTAALLSGACSLLGVPLCPCLQFIGSLIKRQWVFLFGCILLSNASLGIKYALSDSTRVETRRDGKF